MMKLVVAVVDVLKRIIDILIKVISLAERPFVLLFQKVLTFLTPILTPLKTLAKSIWSLLKKVSGYILLRVAFIALITLAIGKFYQNADDDPTRGAIAIQESSLGENYTTPVYVDQGWEEDDSLWFYNTTQGSNLMPYDLFMELELPESTELFRSDANMDALRYLPQKETLFNPDALPVGFVKDTYLDKDYVGYTCAACHTGQVNYKQPKRPGDTEEPVMNAVRIDGGPAMADMDSFLASLEKSLKATLKNDEKKARYVDRVLKRNNVWRDAVGGEGYESKDEVVQDLSEWTKRIEIYNSMNKSEVHYGFARLDAFGRIYNRVLEHVLNHEQVANKLVFVKYQGRRLLSNEQIEEILKDLDGDIVLGQKGFEIIMQRLEDMLNGDEGAIKQVLLAIFNPANAPVSYPFLWDVAQSDYVQWNGLAANAGIGPLGRNTGEVIGVFASLDWARDEKRWWQFWKYFRSFSLSAAISGQSVKEEHIDFKSSINKVNLERLETHLKSLQSPKWEEVVFADGTGLPKIDKEGASWKRGEQLYARYCLSCHEVIDKTAWNRRVVAKMMSVDKVETDPQMATNGVTYTGESGNFMHIYQDTDVGPVIVEQEAPVVQILTAATRGVIATPDADKGFIRRFADWVYTLGAALFNNNIKASVKSGDYEPDTTSNPYASLNAYKARPLNGIWATGPYLHNGSVPTLYDLLLPKSKGGDYSDQETRPDKFYVGCRELDADKVGMTCPEGVGALFDTSLQGNSNSGHEYAAGNTAPLGEKEPLPALNKEDRMALLEYLKTL